MKPSSQEWQSPLFDNSLFRFIWRVSGAHQVGVAIISVVLFAIGAVPLELQRRIVNTATDGGPFRTILVLACLYAGLSLLEGLIKLGLNIYRNWIGESAIRWLRLTVFEMAAQPQTKTPDVSEGVQLSIVIAEAESIGGFVGDSFSQPLLQIGILTTVTSYLIFLQPLMALVIALVFLPQVAFVPILQNAINRRVGEKTSIMRQVSVSIVEVGGVFDADGTQRSRIQTVFEINMGIYKIKFSMNFVMNLMTQMGYIGILAVGGYFVVTKKTEIGTVIAFLSGLGKINDPWGELVDWYRNLRVTQVKYDLVKSVMQST
ncbi:ABC transporter ATP-binding protein [Rhizobium sp. Root1204]|uniref:ABC transporter ATP-binding protein n=1 Tax=Rhizobium sp. Root1204 TaxID=1736428 RepID=UPI000713FC40|nr:ABC transporter ATP-binding protein [Rhizobium sp. Root1204]KQV36668.1 multidrug ABC transporter ATP-binding protein [Rhizobium sp. Root1204]